MSKFHSTVSRRTFMKGLGLAGAGLGAAAATAPVFHDLDEVASAPQGATKHPWYVKELEHEKPTVEIDWSAYDRFDQRIRYQRISDRAREVYAATTARKNAGRNLEYAKEWFPNYQGPSLRDLALTGAGGVTRLPAYGSFGADGFLGQIQSVPRMGSEAKPARIPTPESRDMAKWSGTPEENMRTLRSAARFFGANEIGVVELTANTRKLIYANDGSGKPFNFKNATVPEITDTEYVIPNSCKNVFFFSTLEPTSQVRQAPAPTYTGYDHYGRVVARLHYFLGAMGYQHIDAGGITTSNSWATLSGVSEHSRAGQIATSYKYGNMYRGMHRIITDFPLTPTRPIDAGIAKFCVTCKTCAERCPYEALPLGDKQWDHWDPDCESESAYKSGFNGWRVSVLKCPKCKNCHGNCPFNGADEAAIHGLVRLTLATTTLFDPFLAQMHKTFGYGMRNPDDWWETDVPSGQYDPSFLKA